MQPQTPQFNNGQPLNTKQIQDIRSAVGMNSISKPSGASPGINPRAAKLMETTATTTEKPPEEKGIIPKAFDTFREGFQQTKEGAKNPDLLQGLQQIGRGTLNEMGASLRAIFSPVEAGLKIVSQLPGFHQALGALQDHVIDPAANKISDSPAIQKFMQSNPHADEVFGNLVSIVGTIAGGKVAPEAKNVVESAVEGATSKVKGAVGGVKDAAGNLIDKTKSVVGMGEKEIATTPTDFEKNLNDAQKSIYTKLSPTEKAGVSLKETNGILGKKATPDLINDPKTKPIIESVANLPDDIKLKPGDTVTVKESKLNQGISRLHQDTEGMLNDPKVKAQTAFNDATYNKYMTDNVLNSVKREFGVDSIEYKETARAIKTAKTSIGSNDAHGVYTGRQKFSAIWEKENPRTFKKAKGSFGAQLDPRTTATVEAGRDVYHALNDFNEHLLPENHPLRPRMTQESNLIKAKQEMRERSIGELDKNSVTRSLDRHPIIKKGVKTVGGALKVGAGVDLINHL